MTTVKIKLLADPGNTKATTAEVESSFDGMSAAVTGIFAGLGSQLGSIFGGIGDQLNAALDVGKSQDKLAAQLGLTGDEAAKYGKIAGDLYKGAWGESLDEVNGVIAQVTQNIGEGNEQWLKDTSALTLDFASTFEQDTAGVTRAIATMLNTGIAQSSEEAFDILTKGMQGGANKADDLLDTFTEYPTLFRELGLNGTEAMGLISQSLQAGARDSDFVADALKEFSIRAKDGSTTTAEGFKAIGLNAEQMGADVAAGGERSKAALGATLESLRQIEDPVKRDAAAVALFGTKAEDLGDALFAMDTGSAADALGDVTGAAQEMSDTLNDNAATTLEGYKRQALMGIADLLVNQVVPAFQGVVTVIQTVTGFVADNKEAFIALGIGIAVSLLPVVIGFIPVLLASAAALWANVVAALALAAPFIAVAALIAALVAGVIYAYQNWGWFRDAVDAVADVLTGTLWPALQAVWSFIVNDLVPVLVNIATVIAGVAVTIYNAFDAVISFIWGLPGRIRSAASTMWDGITDALRSAINTIIRLWNALDFGIPGFHIPGTDIGWSGINDIVPDIPYLDSGGIIRRQTLAMVHPDEAVVPLPRGWRNGGGLGGTVVINTLKVDRSTMREIQRGLNGSAVGSGRALRSGRG